MKRFANCRILLALGCCLLGGGLSADQAARAAQPPEGFLADGESFRGRFIAADANGNLTFAEADHARKIASADLVAWGSLAEPGREIQILLPGGLLLAAEPRIDREHLQIRSAIFGEINLPLELVAGIIYRPPQDRAARDALQARLLEYAEPQDCLLLDNADELPGTLVSLDGRSATLESSAGKVTIDVVRLTAIIFNGKLRARSKADATRTLVGYRDGSRLWAKSLRADDATAAVEIDGLKMSGPTDAISALQPLGGRVEYLSDLRPASYRHLPFLQLTWPLGENQSVAGGQLRARGRPYLKGLGMHSPARVTYELEQPYRSFQADVAVDDDAGGRGSVLFRVLTDVGDGQWRERATTAVIRGDQEPTPIRVDLTGVKRISLMVDYADRGDELDHADWLNARLVK